MFPTFHFIFKDLSVGDLQLLSNADNCNNILLSRDSFSPGGTHILSGSSDENVLIWQVFFQIVNPTA